LRRNVSALLGTVFLGLAIWLVASAGATSPKSTVITVTAGADSNTAFAISPFSRLPPGAFTFKVKNDGTTDHNFVLCISPVASAARNACVGYESKDLQPGETTTIKVTNISKGSYEFLSSDPGDAVAGMKGLLGIGLAVKEPKPRTVPKPKPVAPAPVTPVAAGSSTSTTAVTPPADDQATSTTSQGGGYICKQGGVIRGVSTPQDCQFPSG